MSFWTNTVRTRQNRRTQQDIEAEKLQKVLLDGSVERGLRLIERCTNLQMLLPRGETYLHLAAVGGSVPLLHRLLERGLSLDAQTARGDTPLHLAAHYLQKDAVQFLVHQGADIRGVNVLGETPLHRTGLANPYGFTVKGKTRRQRRETIVRFLLSQGAGLPFGVGANWNLLHNAIEEVTPDLLALLLERGGNANSRRYGKPLLFDTCRLNGDEQAAASARILLDHGANVNALVWGRGSAPGIQWSTPLHAAAEAGFVSTARLLIERGADLHAQNYHGEIPLRAAKRNGRTALLQLLQETEDTKI